MKRLNNIFAAATVSLLLTGCGIYNKYENKTETPADAFGASQDIQQSAGQKSIAQMSWREFFTDPLLQQLIERVLANNTDLNSARIAVEKSEAALKAAKMAYLPSLFFSPQGSLTKFDKNPWAKAYDLPLQLSWDIDVFGSLTNKKRAAKAVVLQTKMQQEIVRVNLISTTVQQYLMLQMLDRQLEILTQTDSLWSKSLDTEKSLWENGKTYSTAVDQMEASCLNVKTQIVDTRRNIRSVENAICQLLAVTPQHIQRQKWGSGSTPGSAAGIPLGDTKYLQLGVPAMMLENRPDIRMANHAMEEAFYNTQAARAAFYPHITLSGSVGWTNSGGGLVMDPGKLLLSFIGQLTQPIFARGQLIANKKIAKLTEEDLQKKYVQTVINAGNQVNEAMTDCMAAREKDSYYQRQVEVLHQAYTGTHELMDNGKASYLEVLTAQESLLNAQLSQAMNMYDAANAVVALYIALGGGSEQ
ncbi:MAG: TolC family protein [Paludibacteraceae bacterium]|nr:TolC family protein [Paludibacteraceae bacterium]